MKNGTTKPLVSRRNFVVAGGIAAAVGAAALGFADSAPASAGNIKVVKNPYCGCCTKWANYLERAGWTVTVENRDDVAPVKRRAGVPSELAGCHTAFVDNYVVEGHVPIPAIEKVLAERPDLTGIAVPGMPNDAPGMSGGGLQDVVGFKDGTATGVYTRARD